MRKQPGHSLQSGPKQDKYETGGREIQGDYTSRPPKTRTKYRTIRSKRKRNERTLTTAHGSTNTEGNLPPSQQPQNRMQNSETEDQQQEVPIKEIDVPKNFIAEAEIHQQPRTPQINDIDPEQEAQEKAASTISHLKEPWGHLVAPTEIAEIIEEDPTQTEPKEQRIRQGKEIRREPTEIKQPQTKALENKREPTSHERRQDILVSGQHLYPGTRNTNPRKTTRSGKTNSN